MKYQTIAPPAELSGIVRFFWVLESENPYVHRSMADGCAELIFHYRGIFTEDLVGFSPKSLLHGPASRFRTYETQTAFGIFGTYLYPYVIPSLFGLPASEISDAVPDLETLLGQEGRELEERMMLAGSNAARVQVMCAYLKQRLAKAPIVATGMGHIIRSILNSAGGANIDDLAAKCFLSRRQFERKFLHFSGFSPRKYARIIRFQAAMDKYGEKQISLSQVAQECGYYDQAHFSNDFKLFSGMTPGTYFAGNAEGVGWREV